MLPGRTYTPEDVLQILRKRFWVLIVPFAIVTAGTAVAARFLPNIYRSEAVILVIPQQVPESYVRSSVTTRLEDRLDAIQQQILSRSRLERVIEEFNLYAEERRTGIMEDIIEKMRTTDLSVRVVRGDTFRVSYQGPDPRLVARVTDRLASLFIEESLKDRARLTEGTSAFLENQLEDARRRLVEQEKKLEEYRRRNTGQLPTQLDSNLQALQNLSMQVQSLEESINRDQGQRLLLEGQLAESRTAVSTAEEAPAAALTTVQGTVDSTTAGQLDMARMSLAAMQERGLTAQHPDVLATQRRIRDLQRKLDGEILARPVSAPAAPVRAMSDADRARVKRVTDLQAQVALLDQQVAAKEGEVKRLRANASTYQQNIDQIPARESEMTELMRDYGTLERVYTTLLGKKEESNIAANLERRQIGEQFNLLEPARVPERPVSPNRFRIVIGSMLAGLALGVAIVGLLEYRDSTFKTDEDLSRLLALPVLAVVPLMRSDAEQSRASRRRIFLSLCLGSTVAVCAAVFVYTLIR